MTSYLHWLDHLMASSTFVSVAESHFPEPLEEVSLYFHAAINTCRASIKLWLIEILSSWLPFCLSFGLSFFCAGCICIHCRVDYFAFQRFSPCVTYMPLEAFTIKCSLKGTDRIPRTTVQYLAIIQQKSFIGVYCVRGHDHSCFVPMQQRLSKGKGWKNKQAVYM